MGSHHFRELRARDWRIWRYEDILEFNMKKILALVITFNPSPQFHSVLDLLLAQLDQVLLIDNASSSEIRRRLAREADDKKTSLEVIFNDENIGIASALNQGFRWALAQGYEHVITFDQDSWPAPDMVVKLLQAHDAHLHREKIAIIAPQVQDGVTGEKIKYLRAGGLFMERISCKSDVLDNIALVITSGSLHTLSMYERIGAFRDDFFIDYVDTEYCLRARKKGCEIAVACQAVLHHRLGDQQKKQIGSLALRPTFHSPLRWYYINRNRIVMYGMYAFEFPAWVLHDAATGVYAFLKMLLYEDQKWSKILALALGCFDGLLRRMGPISAERRALLMGKE